MNTMVEEQFIINLFNGVKFQNEDFDAREQVWARISKKCGLDVAEAQVSKSSSTRRLLVSAWSLAAAIVVIVLAGSIFFLSNRTIATGASECVAQLPDGSSVTLSPNSTLRYNRIKWLFDKKLSLDGKAQFCGNHKNGLSVATELGCVSVLGTEFLVDQTDTAMLVACYDGSVNVRSLDGSDQLLNKGEQVICNAEGDMDFSKIEEEVKSKVYNGAPLRDVAKQIEIIYNLKVTGVDSYSNCTYSGTIPEDDLEAALMLVLGSCNIDYGIDGNVVSLK
ncbi:MAG: FecR domain-containing protein [Bacteroidales bacterium]